MREPWPGQASRAPLYLKPPAPPPNPALFSLEPEGYSTLSEQTGLAGVATSHPAWSWRQGSELCAILKGRDNDILPAVAKLSPSALRETQLSFPSCLLEASWTGHPEVCSGSSGASIEGSSY